ncbi:MAG TPA: class I SAM-dependent methyltransferase [Mycobacteriales bacterium]|nr:class I SAM-dependent methyltransferase [Mycobacteriales bacterium]
MTGRKPPRPDRDEQRQEEVWSSLGADDPDWAVLTVRDRRHRGWEDDLSEFYETGEAAVSECLELARPTGAARALDYGAGTGRLSFALAKRFAHVTAVDISPGMRKTLNERAAAAGITNVTTVAPSEVDEHGEHDFAVSLLVLQHLPDLQAVDAAVGVIAGALRPGGVAVIELPERVKTWRARIQPRFRAYRLLRTLGWSHQRLHRRGLSGISMLVVPAPQAERLLVGNGLQVLTHATSGDDGYDYARWVVRRDG